MSNDCPHVEFLTYGSDLDHSPEAARAVPPIQIASLPDEFWTLSVRLGQDVQFYQGQVPASEIDSPGQ